MEEICDVCTFTSLTSELLIRLRSHLKH